MNEWIIPANPNVYDLVGAFAKYGLITWSFKPAAHIGDVIYARFTGVDADTIYKCVVEKVGVAEADAIGAEFWNQSYDYDRTRQNVNLRLIDAAEDEGLRFAALTEHGLSGTHQVPYRLVEPLKPYIESFFDFTTETQGNTVIDRLSDQVNVDDILESLRQLSSMMPPARIALIVQKIARNPRIAQLVKERERHICEICGRPPFLQKNGKPYAEADHIRPLGGNTHGLDSPENIRCICAQCHAVITYGSDAVVRDLLKETKWHF